MQPWNEFWPEFLEREQLEYTVTAMNAADKELGRTQFIEDICRSVYEQYDMTDEVRLKQVRKDFLELLSSIDHIHLSTSRVKTISSILRKIITKRNLKLADKKSPYSSITADTYQNALTDLVGVRIILSYRGDWVEVHDRLLSLFPLRAKEDYSCGILAHESGQAFIAEWPKAYHAKNDDVEAYRKKGLDIVEHEKGYRSVHYIISYCDTYIELQIRTIYDEAWSDVDHRYVYKQEANPSNDALKLLSKNLCALTNLSNDIGEQIKTVFDGACMSKIGDDNRWRVSRECKDFFLSVITRLEKCCKDFSDMCEQMELE